MASAALRSLALAQLAPWTGFSFQDQAAWHQVAQLNARADFAFVLAIRDRQVSIAQKPGLFPPEEIDGRRPSRHRALARAHRYRSFIADVVAAQGFDRDLLLVLTTRDLIGFEPQVPVFTFQKKQGSRVVLLPDIDFLLHDFYRDPSFADRTTFAEKRHKAIFVGATSGLPRITLDDVRERRLPRLRSALRFKGSAEVDYKLPRIVGCDSDETAAAIRALDLGDREYGWAEMFGYRFILSADGNGATCSRVAVALKSNCALIRYASEHQLYYFDALVPWQHYIPVRDDEEVPAVLALCARHPEIAAQVAADGTDFYQAHISPDAVSAYMLELLRLYADLCAFPALGRQPGG